MLLAPFKQRNSSRQAPFKMVCSMSFPTWKPQRAGKPRSLTYLWSLHTYVCICQITSEYQHMHILYVCGNLRTYFKDTYFKTSLKQQMYSQSFSCWYCILATCENIVGYKHWNGIGKWQERLGTWTSQLVHTPLMCQHHPNIEFTDSDRKPRPHLGRMAGLRLMSNKP